MRADGARIGKCPAKVLGFVLSGVFLCLAWCSVAQGQDITGDVVGAVADPAGSFVPNAKITITNVGTHESRETVTGPSGEYAFSLLQPGSYMLSGAAGGFKEYRLSAFNLGAGDRLRLDITLQIGQSSETVEVAGDSVPALQTDSSTVQDVVSGKSVQDLPLNGRNFVNLVQITAGVNQGLSGSIASGNRPDDRRPSSAFSANGQPDQLNNNLIDGLDNNDREQGFIGVRPSIDGIAEVRVQTNNYTAEVGRSTGAVVNVLTKAGSNAFHGTVFEYFRNDVFDARDAFATVGRKPEYRQNNFGGSIGGPIRRDKTFFFGDVEFSRLIAGQTSVVTVPTAAELASPTTVPGYVAGTPVNAVGLRYFQLYPAANLPGTVNNYSSSPNKTQYATTVDARVDHHFSANDLFFVQYTYNPVATTVPGPLPGVKPSWANGTTVYPGGKLFSFDGPSNATSQSIHLDYIHSFTSNLVMELRTGYMRIHIDTLPLNYGGNLSNSIGVVNGNLGDPFSSALTPIYFLDGSASVGDGSFIPILDHNNTFQWNGVLTWNHGPHTLKVGGSLIRRQLNFYQSSFSPQGNFWVSNWAQLLAGSDTFTVRGNQRYLQGSRTWEPSGFLQEDWHALKNLTVNAGVRYEVFTPFTEAHNRYANFDPASVSVRVAGPGYETVGIKTDYSNVSPRLGFALSLPYASVLRGGYGISYYPQDIQGQIQNANPPFAFSCGFGSCPATSFPVLPAPTPADQVSLTNPIGNLNYKTSSFTTGYFQQMNLLLQKEFAGNVVTVGYVGSIGKRLLFQDNINNPAPAQTAQAAGTPAPAKVYAAQLPNVGTITRNSNLAGDNYSSLQATFVRRVSSNLTVNFNYTLAHGLGDAVNPSGSNAPGLYTNNPRYDYSNTAVDIRHRIAFSAVYALPFGRTASGFRALATKGWSVNSIAYWQTGAAFGVTNGVAPQINLPNVSTDRPDRYTSYSRVPASVIAGGKVQCLGSNNTGACFAPQAFGTAGNAPEYSEYGPHQRRVDISFFKEIAAPRETHFQFRAEVFNLTNTPNFANPSNAFETAQFGTITSTTPNQNPRQFQLALKLLF